MTWHGWLTLIVEVGLLMAALVVVAKGANWIADQIIARRRRRVIAEELAIMAQERLARRRSVLDAAARIH